MTHSHTGRREAPTKHCPRGPGRAPPSADLPHILERPRGIRLAAHFRPGVLYPRGRLGLGAGLCLPRLLARASGTGGAGALPRDSLTPLGPARPGAGDLSPGSAQQRGRASFTASGRSLGLPASPPTPPFSRPTRSLGGAWAR
ncbi:hypothetical protein P7K49_028086 [Saguinus oedipus]|uniref:Uncharacterized protein n=1 Tax=Saguinus oedipus TaxID=9490 RepID=A0ABQ9UB77_SAGOE|nr:hypothetical protein P7K49_028086 [Saguinus oedipus]